MKLCFGERGKRFVAYIKREREERRVELARLREEMRLHAEAERRKRELEQLQREQELREQAAATTDNLVAQEEGNDFSPIIVPSHLMENDEEPLASTTDIAPTSNTQIMEPFKEIDAQLHQQSTEEI